MSPTELWALKQERDWLRRIVDTAEEALAEWDEIPDAEERYGTALSSAFEKMRAILEEA